MACRVRIVTGRHAGSTSGDGAPQGRRRGCRTSGTLEVIVGESEKEAPKWDVRGGQEGGQARAIASQLARKKKAKWSS